MPKPKVVPHALTEITIFIRKGSSEIKFSRKVEKYSTFVTWHTLPVSSIISMYDKYTKAFGSPEIKRAVIPLNNSRSYTWKIEA